MTTTRARAPLASRRIVTVWAVAALLAALAAMVTFAAQLPAPVHAPFHIPWPLLAAGLLADELAGLKFEFRRQVWVINLGEVPLLIGLVYTGPTGLLSARLAATLVYAVYRHLPLYKAGFNLALSVLQTVVAMRVYFAVLGDASPVSRLGWLAAVAAALTVNVVSHLGIMVAIAVTDRWPDPGALRTLGLTVGVVTLINSCLGLIALTVLWADELGAGLLAAVFVVVGLGYHAHQSLRLRQGVLERVYDFTRALDGHHDLASVVRATLTGARDTMAAEAAELFLEQGPGWLHYRLNDDGLDVRTAADPGSLARLAMGGGTGILVPRRPDERPDDVASFELAEQGVTEAMAVPFPAGDTRGALKVVNRQSDLFTFSSEDLRALTSMGSHAAVAIRGALLLDRLARELEEKEHQALHDALTGLPNRTLFAAGVANLLSHGADKEAPDPVAVMVLDLDNFKEVNDTLGHGVGDFLLKVTAARLQAQVGEGGTVARLGGDEFAVVVPVVGRDDALRVARDLKRSIETPVEDSDLLIEVRPSIGVALCPLQADDAATLLRLADVARYTAKERHAGVSLYDAGHDHYTARRLTLVSELRQALAAQELTVAYQPQQDLLSGAVIAVEALVRWSHRSHGMVPPDEFIPVAEQTGLIVPLTEFVLTEALAQQARWRRQGFDLAIAVNVSPRVVQDGHLLALVSRRLVQAGVTADRLTLELTEGSLATDPARVAAILNQLATMGVRTSIDDFGTGYSSLSRLSDLPVAEVKIDKSFVFAMASGGEETLVRSIIDLAHNLGLRVVAEGVEDASTLERLRQLRCHVIQGHVLSRPVPAAALGGWLAGQRVGADLPRVIVPLRKTPGEPGHHQ